MTIGRIPVLCLGMLAAACSTKIDLPQGPEAYAAFPAGDAAAQETKIGPLDTLNVTVFREPELSLDDLRVDATGNLLFPLIGDVRAEGKTARELSVEIAKRLGEKYLVDPQVTVVVSSSVSQRIAIEGNVTEPGVYEIAGSSSLIEVIARAKSPTRVAKLDQIVVFRTIDGQRYGAVFDLKKIRAGSAPDPRLLGGDVVVVGFDGVKGAYRDFLQAAPILNLFRPF